ncbi:peptidoglycan-binding protein [Pelagibacterium lentulum]|uniref:Peptidoglycan-binding protein n=1 Tax=Pelagibacterium lentulum TaxID=2029865 RepID=A0A916RI30_9HYPH|nr:peptidoglycan-binding protein [Pelagibacterium lentulum]GGA56818.1 peptidoglycan-binding protein [Pelagibacterium lentulum]
MARINPHHDWHEDARPGGSSAEWESLRNELVALLDQVEGQVMSGQRARAAAMPRAPQPAQRPHAGEAERHNAALRTVRQAVDRLADRSDRRDMGRNDAVAEAIGRIRARQGARVQVEQKPAISASDVAGFAQSLSALSERIELFEAKIASQLGALDTNAEISAQVGQLSEVIELLASAVGESGQVKRLETQLERLAETVAQGSQISQQDTIERIEALAQTIERLTAYQVEASSRDEQRDAEANRMQSESMHAIEESLRNIYDRIDTLESADTVGASALDRLSQDMAALSVAVQEKSAPSALLERIDALADKIERLESPNVNSADMLRESIAVLRDAVSETIEPRFTAIETRIDALSETMQAADTRGAVAGVEAQLRQIATRVDDTREQLTELAALYAGAPTAPEAPDYAKLADMIVARTRAKADTAPQPDTSTTDADLIAIKEQLSRLVARDQIPVPGPNLGGVKDSINKVDSRLARLEAMLNTPAKTSPPADTPERVQNRDVIATAEAPTVEDALAEAEVAGASVEPLAATQDSIASPAPKRPDTMPEDPVSGSPVPRRAQPAQSEAVIPRKTVERGFAIDPEAVERPSKPKSSLMDADDTGPAKDWPPSTKVAATPAKSTDSPDASSVNRSSFIEAARRSARLHPASQDAEPKSLIGRAMARFQRSETEEADEKDIDPTAETAKPANSRPDFVADDDISLDERHEGDEKPESFFSRNKRPLLLSTALIVVIGLTAHFVINRPFARANLVTPPAVAEPVAAEEQTDAAPEEATIPAEPEVEITPVSAANEITSRVPMIDQAPALQSDLADAQRVLSGMNIDPIQTAAIGNQPDRYIERSASMPTVAQLPEISAPEGIEPEMLRQAAESGDMRAQFEIGAILTEGHVVEQDLEQAAAWYERSAAQGFAPAQYRLGNLYEGGRGVERDLEMARLWYQRAAEAGNRMSMHNLASLYASGELENQDFGSAAHWFEQAAARGLTDSQFNLGMLYARGLGVEQNFEQSYLWFSLAAQAGDEDALVAREDVTRSLDADAVLRLNDAVANWKPTETDLATNFAPIGTWDPEFDPGQTISNQEVVKRVQMLLGKLGFDVGEPDGISGPRTREAIAAFEQATGMNESGEVNPRLLAVLGSQPV